MATLFTLALLLAAAEGGPAEPLALVHANVVNLRDGTIVKDATIVLRDGRIASVGSGPAPAGVRVLDLRGKHVLPGLVDAHVHIATLAAAKAALESGVTTARSSGASHDVDVGLRELARRGVIAGPDFLAAGYHVRPRVADAAVRAGVRSIEHGWR